MPDNHQELIQRLLSQLAQASSQEYILDLGESLRDEIAQQVPVATGNMAAKLLRMTAPSKLSFGGGVGLADEIGIGDSERLGNPGYAPRGTIKKFLRDYPMYRRKRGKKFTRQQAWWILSPMAKKKLQQERAAGNYGGGYQSIGSNKAAYFYPQEGSQPEWQASAEAADIHSTYFVEHAVNNWRARDVPRVVHNFLQALGVSE